MTTKPITGNHTKTVDLHGGATAAIHLNGQPTKGPTTMTATVTNLSPTVNELVISRHIKPGEDDPVLTAMYEGVKLARELSQRASSITAAVLKNEMKPEAARHREARDAGFEMVAKATRTLDEACQLAQAEINRIQALTSGPQLPKEPCRDRLLSLPVARRREIIDHAAAVGDDNLISAILAVPPWAVDMTDSDVELVRRNWAIRKYPAELDRMGRLQKASDDARRAGVWANSFVDNLTDSEMIKAAEATADAAKQALAAAKG